MPDRIFSSASWLDESLDAERPSFRGASQYCYCACGVGAASSDVGPPCPNHRDKDMAFVLEERGANPTAAPGEKPFMREGKKTFLEGEGLAV